jgi:hypothetical protein
MKSIRKRDGNEANVTEEPCVWIIAWARRKTPRASSAQYSVGVAQARLAGSLSRGDVQNHALALVPTTDDQHVPGKNRVAELPLKLSQCGGIATACAV